MTTNKLTAIIIDDEQSAIDNLLYLISQYCPHVTVLAQATNVDDGIVKIKELKPCVVFLDIEMPRKNGFELIKYFKEVNFRIIFVTAYDHYAIKAFEVSAVDYLLKPIAMNRLKEAVAKVSILENSTKKLELLQENISSNKIKSLAIPHKNELVIVDIDDVICIEANRMYSKVLVNDKNANTVKEYLYSKKLGDLERILQSESVVRVHRSWLVNLKYFETYSRKNSTLHLCQNIIVPLSKSYRKVIERIII